MPLVVPHSTLKPILRDRFKKVGANIREKRVETGMGPTEFSALIGVPIQTLHKIETGEIIPRDHLKAAIAFALECDVDELYSWPSRDELVELAAKRHTATGRVA